MSEGYISEWIMKFEALDETRKKEIMRSSGADLIPDNIIRLYVREGPISDFARLLISCIKPGEPDNTNSNIDKTIRNTR